MKLCRVRTLELPLCETVGSCGEGRMWPSRRGGKEVGGQCGEVETSGMTVMGSWAVDVVRETVDVVRETSGITVFGVETCWCVCTQASAAIWHEQV